MKRTPARRVIYTVTGGAWCGSLALRFQLSFYPRASYERRLVVLSPTVMESRSRRDLPSVSASRIRWQVEKTGDWVAVVQDGSAADRHLQAILHGSYDTGTLRRRVMP